MGMRVKSLRNWASARNCCTVGERRQKNSPGLAFGGNGKKQLTPEQEEMARLKKRLADAEMERDILKKRWASSPRTVGNLPIHEGLQKRISDWEDV